MIVAEISMIQARIGRRGKRYEENQKRKQCQLRAAAAYGRRIIQARMAHAEEEYQGRPKDPTPGIGKVAERKQGENEQACEQLMGSPTNE